MRKLLGVLCAFLRALALEDLRTILFSSSPVIVSHEIGDEKRFSVANCRGQNKILNCRQAVYFELNLDGRSLPSGKFIRRVDDKEQEMFLRFSDGTLSFIGIHPATLRLWLALMWRASLLLML